MQKIVFISSTATPPQIKFCNELQNFYKAKFWFYELPDRTRGAWWRIDLGDNCKIIPNVRFFPGWRPFSFSIFKMLDDFNPDIVMIGGLSFLGNYFAYLWAKKNAKIKILFTERSRNENGKLRKFGFIWRILRFLYRDLNLVITSAEDIIPQYRDTFKFGDKVVLGQYAADLDLYFSHLDRNEKVSYTYLFANRLTEIYNPLLAIDIFREILRSYPGSRLLMNSEGDLRKLCMDKVRGLGLCESIEFLSNITSWNDLHEIYARSDILLLPARFSNGNFTIVEAMASGMGIIISDKVLGVGKLVIDGHNGYCCEPTVTAFLSRIENYINNPSLFIKHANINRQLAVPFSSKGTAESFSKIITAIYKSN